MIKKKIVYWFAGLMAAAAMSAAMVGCSSSNDPTSSQTQAASTRYTSPDNSYSFTLPGGFTEKKEAASQVQEGATGTAFSNTEGVILGVVSTKPDTSVKTEDVTQETVEQQVRITYPEAQIENFRNEKKGDGQILSYCVKVTVSNVTSILAEGVYTDSDHAISFLLTGTHSSKVDPKSLEEIMDSLEIK